MNQENRVLILTGMTAREIKRDMKRYKSTGEKVRRCYMCRRGEGEITVAFDSEPQSLVGKTIELKLIIRRFGNTKMVYQLCVECMILLKIDDDAEVEQKPEGVFIPFCKN